MHRQQLHLALRAALLSRNGLQIRTQLDTWGLANFSSAVAACSPRVAAEPKLQDKTVLCVGGRSGNVTDYRSIIERIGGRFVHHDGGLEDNLGQLDANLAAADLVICQTGCISHKAYWRVKDHCKRTGKRCVFVDNPSVSALARTLFPRLEENEAAKNATEDANPH